MAPLTPFWEQPSHGDIQEVIINNEAFTSKSLSKVSVPPFGLFAKMSFPPCTSATEPTYATVQMGRNTHLNLNSDLLYINHSCEPSLTFDMSTLTILAGPAGLRPGDELTFFYPSTEWSMAQGFDCFCGAPTCRGRIDGAENMDPKALEGLWLNGYIREMLSEKAEAQKAKNVTNGPGKANGLGQSHKDEKEDAVEQALKTLMEQAKATMKLAEDSLKSYSASKSHKETANGNGQSHKLASNADEEVDLASASASRRGPTSRELSGEMGGDTVAA